MAPSKSKRKPNISRETHSILVSPNSTLYLLDKSEKKILWSCDLNIKVCDAYHEKNVGAYIDAKTNDKGDIALYYCSSSNPPGDMIEWDNTRGSLENYVTKNFVGAVFDDPVYSQVKLDHLGRILDSSSEDYHYCITRSQYVIAQHSCSFKWHLHFSTYAVSFCEKQDSSIELPVLHNCSEAEFIKCCQEINDYKFSRGELKDVCLEDICLKYELKRKNISISSETIRGRSDVFKGKYMEFEAAIKKMPMAGAARKKKKITLSNVHSNMCRWYGGEFDENGDLSFAFEFCPSNLCERFDVPHYKHDLMHMIRGIASGIHHLHQLKLSHGNITPWIVLVSHDGIPKLGVGRCKTATPENKDSDKVNLGYLIAYSFSSAQYRNSITQEQYNRSDPVEEIRSAGEWDAYYLAYILVNYARKPSLTTIAAYTCFWTPRKKLQFIKVVNELIHVDSNSRLREKVKKVREHPFDWRDAFPKEMKVHMESLVSKGTYTYKGCLNLIKFLRNLSTHRPEMKKSFTTEPAKEWVEDDEQLVIHIGSKFQYIIAEVYHALQSEKLQLPEYYYS